MAWFIRALLALVALGLLLVTAGRLGLLRGTPPGDLGVHEGRLKAPSTTPNSVSSQSRLWAGHPRQEAAHIAPLAFAGSGPATIARLRGLLQDWPGAQVVSARDDYLYVQFTTALMKFTDDAEFWFDPAAGVVQVRSASRLGHGDHDVNRQRIETLRAALAAATR
jgi:uncharacterized protein (DUF1499 family)